MRELVTIDSIVRDDVRRAVIGWDRREAPALSVRAHKRTQSLLRHRQKQVSVTLPSNRTVLITSDSKSSDGWRSAPSGSSTSTKWFDTSKSSVKIIFREHWSWQLLLSRIVAAGKSFEQTSVYIFMVTIEHNDINIDKRCKMSCHCIWSTHWSFFNLLTFWYLIWL